jgi:hypothetical protein
MQISAKFRTPTGGAPLIWRTTRISSCSRHLRFPLLRQTGSYPKNGHMGSCVAFDGLVNPDSVIIKAVIIPYSPRLPTESEDVRHFPEADFGTTSSESALDVTSGSASSDREQRQTPIEMCKTSTQGYLSFANSTFACFRRGTSGSAFFHRLRKSP